MAPFVAPLDAFHASTAPADWYEGLVKAYVGDSIAADFYREIAEHLDTGTRPLVHRGVRATPGTPRSWWRRSARRSRRTPGWAAGSPCGGGGCWGRR